MNRPRPGVRSAGFTLIELLTVLAVAAILLAFTFPSMVRIFLRSRLEGLARETAVAMQQARFQAIRNGQQARVCASTVDRTIEATLGATVLVRFGLPEDVSFAAPAPQPAITVAGDCFAFSPDGSVASTGAFRLGDPNGNYLEIRVEPQATARVQVRKWDDTDSEWYTRDQGGKPWEWRI